MKNLIVLAALLFLVNAYTEAKDYVLVGVSGFGTRRPENAWQPSGAHENLPSYGKIFARHELVHYAKKKELAAILEDFDCKDGFQKRTDLGLIILANSWGSGKAHKLAKMYQKECGQLVEIFYLIDGVSKPIGSFKRDIPAKKCINYYQRKGAVRGTAQNNCSNTDYTDDCERLGYGAVQCHIYVEWKGSELAAKHMRKHYLN